MPLRFDFVNIPDVPRNCNYGFFLGVQPGTAKKPEFCLLTGLKNEAGFVILTYLIVHQM